MSTFNFVHKKQWLAHELKELEHLVTLCQQAEGSVPTIYWHLLEKNRSFPAHFLCYVGHQLIGYASFFLFTDGAYLSAMVHPLYRQQKIFSTLFNLACTQLKMLTQPAVQVSFTKGHPGASACVHRLAASFLYAEYTLEWQGVLDDSLQSNLRIARASILDMPRVARMDAACFGSDVQVMQAHFAETYAEPTRECWLAFVDEACVGKLHVHHQKAGALLHDVCIVPEKQGQGLGAAFLKSILKQLHSTTSRVYLEVKASNASALSLYQRCGFEIKKTEEYWQVAIK